MITAVDHQSSIEPTRSLRKTRQGSGNVDAIAGGSAPVRQGACPPRSAQACSSRSDSPPGIVRGSSRRQIFRWPGL